jgi:eukaryotic-like serine/threonine-protein kinase
MGPQILDDRYRLAMVVGEGGMATVYRAWDIRLERWVAIKLMNTRPGLSTDEEQAFLHEARVVARLNHPNVVAVYDAGVSEGRPYLVMELVEGPTLRQRLAAAPLPLEEALGIVEKIAGALQAAHASSILHLDVKPENIIFGMGEEPKLTDFGISRRLGESPTREDGTVLGTAPYLAPEHLTGQPLDGRADVYALGVVLYEMVTGARPFTGTTPAEQARQQLVAEPLAPERLNPALPEEAGRVILRALARDPVARYDSPAALAAALRNFDGESGDTPARAVPPVISGMSSAPTRVVPRVGPLPAPAHARGTRHLPRLLVLPLFAISILIALLAWGGRSDTTADVLPPPPFGQVPAAATPTEAPLILDDPDPEPAPDALSAPVVEPEPAPTPLTEPAPPPAPVDISEPAPPVDTDDDDLDDLDDDDLDDLDESGQTQPAVQPVQGDAQAPGNQGRGQEMRDQNRGNQGRGQEMREQNRGNQGRGQEQGRGRSGR